LFQDTNILNTDLIKKYLSTKIILKLIPASKLSIS